MKKITMAFALFALGCGTATAADLAARPYTKAPPVPVSSYVYDWTGFYVGGNAGYAWGPVSYNHNETAFVGGPVTSSERFSTQPGGFSGGGQVGYLQQFGSNYVLGIEADYDWQRNSDSAGTTLNNFPRTRRSTVGDTWSVVGRGGYAWGAMLAYVRGGYANSELRFANTLNATGALLGESRSRLDGYVLGAGLEYGFAPAWSLGAEYNYYAFNPGPQQQTFNGVPVAAYNDRIDFHVNQVSLKLNYHFGGQAASRY